jgi:hypothetical protein
MMPRAAFAAVSAVILAMAALVPARVAAGVATPTERQTQRVAGEAYVYGYPVVDSYNVVYSQIFDHGGPEYKGPLNQVHHTRTVASPADKAVIAPYVDTPYSHAWLDLRVWRTGVSTLGNAPPPIGVTLI